MSTRRRAADRHKALAARVFKVPIEAVTDSQRRAAKSMVYGHLYGMSEADLLKVKEGSGPVRRLICACCEAETKGRQWHNRDTGYGLCLGCIDFVSKRETSEGMVRMYGHRGIHYDVRGL